MLITRFILPFLGFYLCYSINRQYNECKYEVNISIMQFWTYGSWYCCWPEDYLSYDCEACTISAAILSKLAKSRNVSLLPSTNVATLSTNFSAVNSSIPEIWLEFQISRKSEKDVCVVKSVKDHDPNEGSPKEFCGKLLIGTYSGDACRAGMYVTSTLRCPTASTQVTPTGMVTNTIQTNTGYTTYTKQNAKNITMSTKCIILYTMMAVSYIAAIVTITVEIVMCCKMYERTNKFPWCKVYLKEKVDPLKAENVSTEDQSVTMSLEEVNNPSQSDSSVTCGSDDHDQKVS